MPCVWAWRSDEGGKQSRNLASIARSPVLRESESRGRTSAGDAEVLGAVSMVLLSSLSMTREFVVKFRMSEVVRVRDGILSGGFGVRSSDQIHDVVREDTNILVDR